MGLTGTQSGCFRPSVIDFFITDFHADFKCAVSDYFDAAHRPVILTNRQADGPPSLVLSVDWERYKEKTARFTINSCLSSRQEIDSSFIRHRRTLRRRGQILGSGVVAAEIRDITAAIRKRISFLRILEWDRTLRAFKKPDPR